VEEFSLEQIKVKSMVEDEEEDGIILLLRCAGIIDKKAFATDVALQDREEAREFSRTSLGGLPLALDQAGAFIRRKRKESPDYAIHDYARLYETRRVELLRMRGKFDFGHPELVVVTFDLCFKEAGDDARELLRFFAFLNPDGIPEELVTKGAPVLGPLLASVASDEIRLDNAIENLLNYSLVEQLAGRKSFAVHRLVQAVMQDIMDKAM